MFLYSGMFLFLMERKLLAAYILGVLGGIAGVVHSGVVFSIGKQMQDAQQYTLESGSLQISLS